MVTGTVKFFNVARGYGFIAPEDGSKDAFVHISAVESAGLSSLSEGQKVSYELQPGQEGKFRAENLEVVSGAAAAAAGDDAADAGDESGEDAEVSE